MPILQYTNSPIEVEISDRIYNGTIFKQKAAFLNMFIEKNQMTNVCSLLVRVYVTLYANANGNYGDPITGKGINGYNVTLVADNNCAVDPTTGDVKYIRGNEPLADWIALIDGKDETLMWQGDFFDMLMHTQSVAIEPMLRGFMLQADQEPFNKYQS